MESRAKTAEEVRGEFMDACRFLVDYWAGPEIERQSCHERLAGLLHSILCIFDGVSMDLPAFDIVAQPHPDDKEYLKDQGDDWIEPGTVINDTMLHELLYRTDLAGVWHRHG